MFQVKFLVDDEKFGGVMAGLSGRVMNLEWKHIVNTKVENGKVKAMHPAGSVRDALIPEMLRDAGVKKSGQFTLDFMRATIEKLGGSPRSVNTNIDALQKRKAIKRVGRGVYTIVSKG